MNDSLIPKSDGTEYLRRTRECVWSGGSVVVFLEKKQDKKGLKEAKEHQEDKKKSTRRSRKRGSNVKRNRAVKYYFAGPPLLLSDVPRRLRTDLPEPRQQQILPDRATDPPVAGGKQPFRTRVPGRTRSRPRVPLVLSIRRRQQSRLD